MGNLRFILSGGGTGGHIYPAIAIADELKSRFPDAEFLFVGASDKMEMQKVPEAGYKIEGLWIAGLQRKLTLQNMMFPVKLLSSLFKSKRILNDFKPDVVIGTGGFASGPLLQAAVSAKIPTLIQEQNSFPGITNRILSKKVDRICVAYDNLERYFPKDKIVLTGNPVRNEVAGVQANRVDGLKYFNLDPNKKTLLVLGGSLGSRRINQLIAKELFNFGSQNVQVVWQCGKFYFEEYRQFNEENDIHVRSFIGRMDLVYAVADIIISRAGASSVSELCIVGKPVIFIPSPNVAEDHQTKNARAITDKGAAILIREHELDTKFTETFNNLLNDEKLQADLSVKIRSLAKENAANDIADEVVRLIKNHDR